MSLPRLPALFILMAGLFGLAGVALAAAAAHGTDARLLGGASAMCLAHAPALIGLAFAADRLRLARLAGAALALGTAVFAGDLVLRHVAGHGLFPLSAPTGGVLMMAGWLMTAIGGALALLRGTA
ncbi:DUF423 domain-containing protein [Rhizobium sp. CC-YZS058]|uniref:DUF423 domain-containing protein n=1 Tax=Rhizobium sp. CC-YZS058 TaxID=3042153 RepID=UPI002B060F0B|nr:DUF423 domain-containing protein [Rhizobium sp. CC-YZS058]MEA3534051.1 DUF423 domain-containing protein [Rhizobium sp. CC-YZS058]